MKKRFLSWLLVLTLVTSLIPSTLVTTALAALAAGDGVNIADATTLTNDTNLIENTGTYKISGARQNPVKITAAGKVVLVLDGVTITTATSPIELADGAQVTLVVKDDTTNTLTCTAAAVNAANSGKTAGILVPESASLTIDRAQGADGHRLLDGHRRLRRCGHRRRGRPGIHQGARHEGRRRRRRL